MYTGGMDESISPRRSIATHRQTTPGGVNVTTTTMTTERMKDMRLDASFNGSCFMSIYIENSKQTNTISHRNNGITQMNPAI